MEALITWLVEQKLFMLASFATGALVMHMVTNKLNKDKNELMTSAGNDFYGVNTSHAADPGTGVFIDYGVPGYIPAQGHVTFFNDVAIGTAQDVAQIRISGNTYKLRADVVAS